MRGSHKELYQCASNNMSLRPTAITDVIYARYLSVLAGTHSIRFWSFEYEWNANNSIQVIYVRWGILCTPYIDFSFTKRYSFTFTRSLCRRPGDFWIINEFHVMRTYQSKSHSSTAFRLQIITNSVWWGCINLKVTLRQCSTYSIHKFCVLRTYQSKSHSATAFRIQY